MYVLFYINFRFTEIITGTVTGPNNNVIFILVVRQITFNIIVGKMISFCDFSKKNYADSNKFKMSPT